jgi:CHAT domain-containing protein/Flp pilus assembly protein TadD
VNPVRGFRSLIHLCLQAALVLGAVSSGILPLIAAQRRAVPTPPSGPKTSEQRSDLVVGVPIQRELALGQSHAYFVAAAAGDFVQITIEQQGVDIAATLSAPDGREIVSLDAMDDEFRPEILVASVDMAGRYEVRVRPAPSARTGGRYTVHLDVLRQLEAADTARIEAERAFAHGRQVRVSTRAATWPDALASFHSALDVYRHASDRRGEMKALLEIGITEYYMNRPDALEDVREAARIGREVNDRAATARALRSAGNTLVFRGDLAAALQALEESTAISRAIGHSNAECRSLNDTGIVYRRMGDFEKAIALYERAMALAIATKDDSMQVNLANNLGVAYKNLGEFDQARKFYEQTLASRRAAKDVKGEYFALGNLGVLYRRLGDYQKALDYSTRFLEVARQVDDPESESSALNEIGWIYNDLGDYARALDYHRRSLAIRQQIGDMNGQALALEATGRALHRLGRDDEAAASLDEALAIARRIRERFHERDTLGAIAELERDRGNLAAAAQFIEQSIDLDEKLRAEIASPELRASFFADEQDTYELFIDVLQRQQAADPSGGFAGAALQVSERARARVLLDGLLDARVDLREGIEPGLLDRQRKLQKQLNDASAQLSRALAKSGAVQTDTGARKVDELTREYDQLQAEIRRQSPRYASLTQPEPLSAAQIQQTVLDDDTVLLEFAVGDERSWLWTVTRESVAAVELPRRAIIDAAARSVYEAMTARQRRRGETAAAYARRVAAADNRVGREAAALGRMLFGPIAGPLGREWRGKRLAIVATGALQYLPFAALPLPEADRSVPLVARHEIVTIPSASVLAVMRKEMADRGATSLRTVAILADPVFDRDDPRVATRAASAIPSSPAATIQPAHLHLRAGLERLPFSRDEAKAIASLAGPDQTFEATGFAANREAVLNGALAKARIVHFATHGVVDSERPALSSLVLSLVDEHGVARDGYLRLHDIYNLRLDAELVVLSACQTALGKEIRGEGLVGLARAFMYTGAPRVVASLWEVNDLATAELMTRFYRGMLTQHLRPAAALRAAQLEMTKDPRWSAPYYWAGFVLQGDWK